MAQKSSQAAGLETYSRSILSPLRLQASFFAKAAKEDVLTLLQSLLQLLISGFFLGDFLTGKETKLQRGTFKSLPDALTGGLAKSPAAYLRASRLFCSQKWDSNLFSLA